MRRSEVLAQVKGVVSPVLANLGCDLVEVALVVSHGRRTLRVFIHKPAGITLDDCAGASKALGFALDASDLFSGRYYLEVSSPGAERKLRTREDYKRFVGKLALVRLREAREGVPEVKGRIEGLEGDVLRLRPEGESAVEIPLEAISSARLCI